MPRKPRDAGAGFHHVWVNATGNWALFLDDVDRTMWVRRFVHLLGRYEAKCVIFCQMTTHVHAILDVPDGVLPRLMRDLNREHSKDFNTRHSRVGAFLRKRYGSRRIENGDDLVGTFAYVANNPEKEGICGAETWQWSSYRTTLGLCDDFPFVDASSVLGEVGSVDELRRAVSAQLRGSAV